MDDLYVDSTSFLWRALESLAAFRAMAESRHAAFCRDGESLHEWVVGHGRWYLNSRGEVGLIELTKPDGTVVEPIHGVRDLGAVMTADEFRAGIQPPLRLCYDSVALPEVRTTCAICGQTWNIENLHTALVIRDGEKRLFVHKVCRASQLTERAETELRTLCGVAQMGIAELTQVPNRYGSLSYRGPWFQVRLDDGTTFTFGWRKRVMYIEWSKDQDLSEVFGDVKNSKGPNFVHAWNHAEAADYLRRLRDNLRPSTTNA